MLKPAFLAFLPALLCAAAPVEDPNCPNHCPAFKTQSPAGTQPPGITYQMLFLDPVSGSGSLTCATCTQCTMTGSLIFNGNGTGWCIRVFVGGVGGSQPLPAYSRPGKLSALCDSSDCVYIDIVNCTTGASSGFTELACVSCGCDAQ